MEDADRLVDGGVGSVVFQVAGDLFVFSFVYVARFQGAVEGALLGRLEAFEAARVLLADGALAHGVFDFVGQVEQLDDLAGALTGEAQAFADFGPSDGARVRECE